MQRLRRYRAHIATGISTLTSAALIFLMIRMLAIVLAPVAPELFLFFAIGWLGNFLAQRIGIARA